MKTKTICITHAILAGLSFLTGLCCEEGVLKKEITLLKEKHKYQIANLIELRKNREQEKLSLMGTSIERVEDIDGDFQDDLKLLGGGLTMSKGGSLIEGPETTYFLASENNPNRYEPTIKDWLEGRREMNQSKLERRLLNLADTNKDGLVSFEEQGNAWKRAGYEGLIVEGPEFPKLTLDQLKKAVQSYETPATKTQP